jgi:membrane carboxypeptidase/penicillin-binding protein
MPFDIEGALRLKEMKVLQITDIDRKLRDAKEDIEKGDRIESPQFREWRRRARLAKDYLSKEVREINLQVRIENSRQNGMAITPTGGEKDQRKAQTSAKRYIINIERSELLKECRAVLERSREDNDVEVNDLLDRIDLHLADAERVKLAMTTERLDDITAMACAVENPELVFLGD